MGYVNEAYLAKLEAEFAVSRKEKMLAQNMLQKDADGAYRDREGERLHQCQMSPLQ